MTPDLTSFRLICSVFRAMCRALRLLTCIREREKMFIPKGLYIREINAPEIILQLFVGKDFAPNSYIFFRNSTTQRRGLIGCLTMTCYVSTPSYLSRGTNDTPRDSRCKCKKVITLFRDFWVLIRLSIFSISIKFISIFYQVRSHNLPFP